MTSAFLRRIKSGSFTDADVATFYVTFRDEFGPFIREVGDYVAHPNREKGKTFEATVTIVSQFACYFAYQNHDLRKRQDIVLHGECPWWMRHYLLSKIDLERPKAIRAKFQVGPRDLKKKVRSWFPDKKQAFPTRIEPENPFEFLDLFLYLKRKTQLHFVFDTSSVLKELMACFKKLGIPRATIDDFLVATGVVLNGNTVTIHGDITAQLLLEVRGRMNTERFAKDKIEAARTGKECDGPLYIAVDINSLEDPEKKKGGMLGVWLETGITTERYFDREISRLDENGYEYLELRQDLEFVSDRAPKVKALTNLP